MQIMQNAMSILDKPVIKHNPIILRSMEQGSLEWIMARLGRVTASNMHKLLTGGEGKTRDSYLLEIASEIISGVPSEKINTWDMVRGNTLEPYAIQAYEVMTGLEVERVGLIYLNKDKRIAASPDGLTSRGGVEVKCPNPKNHMRTIIEGKNPKKHAAQLQTNLWVSGAETWDYVSFCPEFKQCPIFIIPAQRDEVMIDRIRTASEEAVYKIDEYVKMATGEPVDARLSKILREANEIAEALKEPNIF